MKITLNEFIFDIVALHKKHLLFLRCFPFSSFCKTPPSGFLWRRGVAIRENISLCRKTVERAMSGFNHALPSCFQNHFWKFYYSVKSLKTRGFYTIKNVILANWEKRLTVNTFSTTKFLFIEKFFNFIFARFFDIEHIFFD